MSDLTIPKQTKKMLLFVSVANPFWQKIMRAVPTQNEIAKTIKVAHGTIPSWKTGININPNTAYDAFAETEKKIKHDRIMTSDEKSDVLLTLNRFKEAYYKDDIGVYQTAKMLNMGIEQCQKIIDEVIYKRGPVFPGMYYSSKSAADEYVMPYKGVFYLWLRRGTVWLQGSLRVRYVIEMGLGFAIRCKLNFPIIDDGAYSTRPYWEYDGFLVRRPNRVFWMFEKRQRDRNDHFYFITGVGRTHPKTEDPATKTLTLGGTYLTTGQDEVQTVVHDDVILQHAETQNEQKMLNFMHEAPKILQGQESTKIAQLWKEFNKPFQGDHL